MSSMSKRQNAGEYNNGLPLMSSNSGCYRRVSRTPLLSHFLVPGLKLTSTPPVFVQSYQIIIKARARTPSRRGTIFRLVRGMYNLGNLGSFKRVAPLRLSPCCGAPSLDLAHLFSSSFFGCPRSRNVAPRFHCATPISPPSIQTMVPDTFFSSKQ